MRKLGTSGAEGFSSITWYADELQRGWFVADFDIDSDGGSNPDGDPYWQPNTTLKHEGKSIDAETVAGIVVPGWLPKMVGPIVLGCQARCRNLATNQKYPAVVHDLGPLRKNGEGTPYLARKIGINPHAIYGGEDEQIIVFEFWPGVPAVVDGVTYQLQHI